MKSVPRGIPCLTLTIALFGYLSSVMGFTNMLNTIMRTAHDLLLNTVFYLMAMCVLTGALSRIFSVFGVVDLLQRMLKPVLVSTSSVFGRAGWDGVARVQRLILSLGPSPDFGTILRALGIDRPEAIGEGSITVAELGIPGTDLVIPIEVDLSELAGMP